MPVGLKIRLTPWPWRYIMLPSPAPGAAEKNEVFKRSEGNAGKRRWFYGHIHGCSGRVS